MRVKVNKKIKTPVYIYLILIEKIESIAQNGLESCAAEGFYIPYETHLLLAELAFLTTSVAELTDKVETLIANSKTKLELMEDGNNRQDGNDILSTF